MGPISLPLGFSEENKAKSTRAGHLTFPGFRILDQVCKYTFTHIGVHATRHTHTLTARNKTFCWILNLSVGRCSEIPAGDVGLYDLPDFYMEILLDKLNQLITGIQSGTEWGYVVSVLGCTTLYLGT